MHVRRIKNGDPSVHPLAGHELRALRRLVGGISSEVEEQELQNLNGWAEARGLRPGLVAYDFAGPVTGEQQAVFDLAWPQGIQ